MAKTVSLAHERTSFSIPLNDYASKTRPTRAPPMFDGDGGKLPSASNFPQTLDRV